MVKILYKPDEEEQKMFPKVTLAKELIRGRRWKVMKSNRHSVVLRIGA